MKRNEDEINVRLWCREGLEGDGDSLASRFTEGITGEWASSGETCLPWTTLLGTSGTKKLNRRGVCKE